MRRGVYRFLCILAALALAFITISASIADAGDFSGDTDWGGGSDWSDSDWSSSDWDDGSDWSSSSWDSSESTGVASSDDYENSETSDADFWTGLLGFVVIAAIIMFVSHRMKKFGNRKTAVYQASAEGPGLDMEVLREKDPNFNEQALLEKVRNQYVKMQQAWEKRDWEPMRAIMTDALYNQMKLQLDGLEKKGWTNHIERIAVLDATIRNYMVEGDNDVLIVRLKTRITDYTTDDQSGAVIKGSKTNELFMTYDWKLIRNKDRKTLDTEDLKTVSCPHCGAPLSVNQSARCDYCGTVITLSDHDWALSAVKGISQVTGKK